MKNFALLFFVLFLITGCNKLSRSPLDDIAWIEGEWQRTFNETTQVERWQRDSNHYEGRKIFVNSHDSTVMDYMRIYEKNNVLILEDIMAESNIKTDFLMLEANSDSVVFENPKHNFPKRIVYRRIGTDSLELSVIGTAHEVFKSATFKFGRSGNQGKELACTTPFPHVLSRQ